MKYLLKRNLRLYITTYLSNELIMISQANVLIQFPLTQINIILR